MINEKRLREELKAVKYLVPKTCNNVIELVQSYFNISDKGLMPEKKEEEKKYHHVCYAGSTVCLVNFWADKQKIKCDYKKRYEGWETYKECKQCNGFSEANLEYTEWCQKYVLPYNQAIDEMLLRYMKNGLGIDEIGFLLFKKWHGNFSEETVKDFWIAKHYQSESKKMC